LRTTGEQKGEKSVASFRYKFLLLSDVRRLRQDLKNQNSRLEGRRSIRLSYGRAFPDFSHYKHLRNSLLHLDNCRFRYIRYQLLQEAGIKTTRLDKIVRQRDLALKEAVEHLARGQVAEAFRKLDNQGRMHEIAGRDDRIRRPLTNM
jgi:hypothetical protein